MQAYFTGYQENKAAILRVFMDLSCYNNNLCAISTGRLALPRTVGKKAAAKQHHEIGPISSDKRAVTQLYISVF